MKIRYRLTLLFAYLLRLRARLLYWWAHQQRERAERAHLRVQLHELNRGTIRDAERRMQADAESRVLRSTGGVMHYTRGSAQKS